ncbi:DUF4245 domain-containing protein [Streptomyces sp. NPDC093252]|uniref:DUF4245 domain-containing protein n=1 Tax=Streptomyces sp. NPDC093252 TaxID=3154980 RepID=UPI00342B8F22
MAGTNGKQKTVRDMILSLGLIVLAAYVIYLFIPHDDTEPETKPVDYRVELLTAQRAASYPVAAPEGLPDTWKPTSVRYQGQDGEAWHLGFSAPDGEYVAVEQSTQARARFIDDTSRGGDETEVTQDIEGRTWIQYTGGRYSALVLDGADGSDGSTTMVIGTGSFGQLATMAQALKLD